MGTSSSLSEAPRGRRLAAKGAKRGWFDGSPGLAKRKSTPPECAAPLRRGIFACAAVLVGFGGWATFATISGAVVAHGRIVVEGSVRNVQHPDGGVIAEVLVRDGDAVRKGEVLLRLDPTQLESDIAALDSRLQEAQARRARLEAERDGLSLPDRPVQLGDRPAAYAEASSPDRDRDDGVKFRLERVTVEPSDPERDGPTGEQSFEAEVGIFRARAASRDAQEEQLDKAVARSTEQIEGLRQQRSAHLRRGELIEEELAVVRTLVDKRIVPIATKLELERKASEIEGLTAGLTAEIAMIERRIEQLEAHTLEREQDWREEVSAALRQADLEVKEILERRTSLLGRLTRSDLRAPMDGVVNNMTVDSVGAVVRPAETVMQIVPDAEDLIVEAAVDPAQIDRLTEGQPARVGFSALDARRMPDVTGVLIHLSADVVEDPRTLSRYYRAEVRIAADELGGLNSTGLVPGMPADVFFETGRRSPMSYVLRPLFARMDRALTER